MINLDNNIITKMYLEQNMTGYEIAKELGCSKNTIYRRIQKLELEKSREDKNSKRENTCIQRYGVKNVSQSKEIQSKKANTMLKNYGDADYLHSDATRDKIKETNLRKYGVDNPMKNEDIKRKSYLSLLKYHGYVDEEDYRRQKTSEFIEKYGVSNPVQSPEFREVMKTKMEEKYGYKYALQVPEFREHFEKTMMKRYNVKYASQSPGFAKIMRIKGLIRHYMNRGLSEELATKLANEFYDDSLAMDYLNKGLFDELMQEYALNKGYIYTRCQQLNINPPKKYKPIIKSSGETTCKLILHNLGIEFITEKRFPDCKDIAPLAFDFYLPQYNACIEYDGIQHFQPVEKFGSEAYFTEIQIHDQIKNEYCQKNNIPLLRISYLDQNIEETIKIFKNSL